MIWKFDWRLGGDEGKHVVCLFLGLLLSGYVHDGLWAWDLACSAYNRELQSIHDIFSQ